MTLGRTFHGSLPHEMTPIFIVPTYPLPPQALTRVYMWGGHLVLLMKYFEGLGCALMLEYPSVRTLESQTHFYVLAIW